MDKISKFLKKLNKHELEAVLLVLSQIERDYTKVPGILKLTGYKNLYRVRVGRYRIIFKISNLSSVVLKISKRNENTYDL